MGERVCVKDGVTTWVSVLMKTYSSVFVSFTHLRFEMQKVSGHGGAHLQSQVFRD